MRGEVYEVEVRTRGLKFLNRSLLVGKKTSDIQLCIYFGKIAKALIPEQVLLFYIRRFPVSLHTRYRSFAIAFIVFWLYHYNAIQIWVECRLST